MHVLLVDSDEARASHWQALFEAHEVTVTVAHNETAASDSGTAERHAAVVVAFGCFQSLQIENLIRQLRAKSKWIACLTDRDQPAEAQAAYESGFDDCLFLDSSPAELRMKVSHVRQLSELDQRLAQAQKLESIGELAAGIAHEINTPIQYVGDNTRFVQNAYQDLADVLEQCQVLVATAVKGDDVTPSAVKLREAIDAADVEYLQEEVPSAISQTLEGVDRVANIVRAMKEFAHPGATEMTATDLSRSIENTVMVARNEWKYVAEMRIDCDPDLPLVPCLPGEINQVLLNMIVNAAHAIGASLGDSPEDKGTIRISTSSKAPYAEIRIADTGSGISAENIEKIFAPFFTTKAAGKGTGQGLAIAHSVVTEKHGGTISVESTVGEGTTFIIRLPLAPSGAAPNSSENAATAP